MNDAIDAASDALAWSDALVTGHAGIDATHRAFIDVANALVASDDAGLPARLRAFEAHARAHFDEEDALMRASNYPSAGCHVDEHAAVLQSVAEVIADVEAGNPAIGRALADELVRWFPEHTHHMDKSLTAWLCQRSTGAAPLVFRRAVTSQDLPQAADRPA